VRRNARRLCNKPFNRPAPSVSAMTRGPILFVATILLAAPGPGCLTGNAPAERNRSPAPPASGPWRAVLHRERLPDPPFLKCWQPAALQPGHDAHAGRQARVHICVNPKTQKNIVGARRTIFPADAGRMRGTDSTSPTTAAPRRVPLTAAWTGAPGAHSTNPIPSQAITSTQFWCRHPTRFRLLRHGRLLYYVAMGVPGRPRHGQQDAARTRPCR